MLTKYAGIYLATLILLAPGLTQADYEAGVSAALSGDYQTALREFTLAAEQGLDLAELGPNLMVKIPGSAEGYRVIEELTARGQLSLESVTFLRGRSLQRQIVVIDVSIAS